jgi:hypothetical protein
MLQNKTNEDVIKGSGGVRQGEDVRSLKLRIGETRRIRLSLGLGH